MVIVKRFPDTMSAHIARSILAEEGIEAFVADENLANADPPVVFATGGVRLMVSNENEERAHRILEEMDAGTRHVELPDDFDPGKDTLHQLPPKRPRRLVFSIGSLVVALVLGALAMRLWWQTAAAHVRIAPNETREADVNGDGVNDSRYVYKNGELIHSTEDANFDGTPDVEYDYADSLVKSGKFDRDFDGRFESAAVFDDHLNYVEETDLNGDGVADVVTTVEHGIAVKTEWFQLGQLRKVANFGPFGRLNESVDADGDGELDTYREFDAFGEIEN